MRGEVTIGTMNTKRVLGVLANIGGSGNESGLLMRGNGRSKMGMRLFMAMSFKMRAFKTMAFNGDMCDDDVEKGIRRRRRLEIGRVIKVILGALGDELLEIWPDSI